MNIRGSERLLIAATAAMAVIVLGAALTLERGGGAGDIASRTPRSGPSMPQTIGIDLEDSYFTAQQLVLPAGSVIEMAVHNDGYGVHSWDVPGVIETGPLAPGQTRVVTFTVATPGTYAFVCDVHPQKMAGVMVIR